MLLLLYCVFKTNPLVSLALTFLTNSSCTVFFAKSTSTTLLKLLKSAGVISSLTISNLPISSFKLDKSASLANFDVPASDVFFLK